MDQIELVELKLMCLDISPFPVWSLPALSPPQFQLQLVYAVFLCVCVFFFLICISASGLYCIGNFSLFHCTNQTFKLKTFKNFQLINILFLNLNVFKPG